MSERQVNVHEAKTHLSELLAAVEAGAEVIIGRAGRPVARLVKYQQVGTRRRPGVWRNRVWMAPDFDTLPPEVEAAFKGESD